MARVAARLEAAAQKEADRWAAAPVAEQLAAAVRLEAAAQLQEAVRSVRALQVQVQKPQVQAQKARVDLEVLRGTLVETLGIELQ